MTRRWMATGAGTALISCWLAAACDATGGGSTCFSPTHGPSDTSCAGFDHGLSCPVDLAPWYVCTCTASSPGGGGSGGGSASPAWVWVCALADAAGSGGAATSYASTGGGATGGGATGGSANTGDAGPDGGT
jgi:hypothetical protein